MDLTIIGNEGFLSNRRCYIEFRRNDYRPSQKSVQSLHLYRLGWGRYENGDRNTPLGHNDPSQPSATDPIENIQALRLELAGADDPGLGHVFTPLTGHLR